MSMVKLIFHYVLLHKYILTCISLYVCIVLHTNGLSAIVGLAFYTAHVCISTYVGTFFLHIRIYMHLTFAHWKFTRTQVRILHKFYILLFGCSPKISFLSMYLMNLEISLFHRKSWTLFSIWCFITEKESDLKTIIISWISSACINILRLIYIKGSF